MSDENGAAGLPESDGAKVHVSSALLPVGARRSTTETHPLRHEAIAHSEQTCMACPEQWEGRLTDGRYFYFRFRHSRASLAVGDDQGSVNGRMDHVIDLDPGGDSNRGLFNDGHEAAEVFGRLLELVDDAR